METYKAKENNKLMDNRIYKWLALSLMFFALSFLPMHEDWAGKLREIGGLTLAVSSAQIKKKKDEEDLN